MKPVSFHSEAADELTAACEWYDEQRPGLGEDLWNEVRHAVERIQQSPGAFARYGKDAMGMHLVNRFPYTVYYLELDKVIWIAAVAHQKRRPGYWKRRISPNT